MSRSAISVQQPVSTQQPMRKDAVSTGGNYSDSMQDQNAASANPATPNNPQMQAGQMWHVKLLMDTGAAMAASANSQQSWDSFVQYAKNNGLDDDGHLPAVFDPRVAMHYALLGLTVSDQLSAQLKQMLAPQSSGNSQPQQRMPIQSAGPSSSTRSNESGSTTPQIGQVQDGYRYLGGHPGRASNWIPVPAGA